MEYTVLVLEHGDARFNLIDELNRLSREGWKLTHVITFEGNVLHYLERLRNGLDLEYKDLY